MTDSALMYFGNEAPNGSAMSSKQLDVLRTAFEIAFSDLTDEEMTERDFDPATVWGVGRRIEEAYASSVNPA